jgi:DNA-binding transcriptional regulator YiaG
VYDHAMARRRPAWDKNSVRALRQHLGLTQDELARRMGTRQQTISEWETGMYAPRGVSERMLGMVAEQAGFAYEAGAAEPQPVRHEPGSEELLTEPETRKPTTED